MSTLVGQLADWSVKVSFSDLPQDIVDTTKQRLLDVIGVAFAGRSTEFGAALGAVASKTWPASQLSGFHAAGAATFPHLNAFVNGSLAAALDYDDTHNETVIHSTSPTAAAVLALAETMPLSGQAVILSIAVGSEICCRIGVGAPGEFHKRGFHPTGIIGAYGAAAGAAKALGLDRRATVSAMGLVSSLGSGIMQSWVDGTDARYIHNGHAALSGLLSAQLAAGGVSGPEQCLEGKFGVFTTHLQGAGTLPLARVVDGLGVQWESRNISFKPYPTAHVSHSFIDALLELVRKHDLKADDVESMTCYVAEYMAPIVCEPKAEKAAPATPASARVSLQHTLAEALVFRDISAASFSPERLKDPRVRRLASSTQYAVDANAPGRERFKGWVKVKLKDGRELECIKDHNWGSAANPMTRDDIIGKFVANMSGAMSEPAARNVAQEILTLETAADLRSIFGSLDANRIRSAPRSARHH